MAMKSDTDGYIAIIFAPTYRLRVSRIFDVLCTGSPIQTFDPKVKYPNTAIISYVKVADPMDPAMTMFMRFWVLLLSSL